MLTLRCLLGSKSDGIYLLVALRSACGNKKRASTIKKIRRDKNHGAKRKHISIDDIKKHISFNYLPFEDNNYNRNRNRIKKLS